MTDPTQTTDPFTPAEAAFWAVFNEHENLPDTPDEPEVGFTPIACWRHAVWEAVQSLRAEDVAKRRELERRCGTCRWWGFTLSAAESAAAVVKPCDFPLPIWLDEPWSSHAHAGTDCRGWEPVKHVR